MSYSIKFSVDKSLLATSLGRLLRVLPKRTSKIFVAYLFLEVGDCSLSIKASNGRDLYWEEMMPISSQITGNILIQGQLLCDTVPLLPGSLVEFCPDDARNGISVRGEKTKYTLCNIMSTDNFYPFPSVGSVTFSFSIKSKSLLRLLEKTIFIIKNEQTVQSYMHGLFLKGVNGGLQAVSLTRSRLSFAHAVICDADGLEDRHIALPRKTITELCSLLASQSDESIVHLKCSLPDGTDHTGDALVHVEVGGSKIIARLIRDNFPDHYKKALPTDNSGAYIFSSVLLHQGVKRVRAVMQSMGKGAIEIALTGDGVRMEAIGQGNDHAEDFVPAISHPSDPKEECFSINADYLVEVLSHTKGDIELLYYADDKDTEGERHHLLIRETDKFGASYILGTMRKRQAVGGDSD